MRIVVLTPSYSGTVNTQYMMSLMRTITRIKKSECMFFTVIGMSILPMARNLLIAKGLALGADAYFVKPLLRKELLNALRNCIGRPPNPENDASADSGNNGMHAMS